MDRHRNPWHRLRTRTRHVSAFAGALVASGAVLVIPQGSIASASTGAKYPVTVSSCGVPLTFDKAPTRAVSNDINTTEDMLALGLEPDMVGDFGVTGDGPVGQPVPSQYLAGFHKVRDVSSNYFTLEELVGLHPDFLFAGWNYGLQVGTNLTPANLAKYGIKTLVLDESCAHVQSGKKTVSIDNTYQDLNNLGLIFGVQSRAQQVISSMQHQVSSVQKEVAGLKPIKVFDYDSGEAAPFTGPGLAMVNALIQLGGGTNIFSGLKQSWTSVSWEQVTADQPQCIIINDYGTPTAEQKEKFLETSPIAKNLPAVKNRCFLALSYDEVTPSPRNAGAVVAIAHWLHPSAFGLPADGS
ncbi:MAG TPA: ABC transporter substrate-binding protein [Acidimicrobiales bacterium]|nr:ABC transporter substrate-binding protein [Acidimicrobiales bacterium]